MAYRIEFTRAALRDLATIPKKALRRIDTRIQGFAADPRPPGARKLAGVDELWRIRVGAYRVVCLILDDALIVTVVRIRHRRDVYRNL